MVMGNILIESCDTRVAEINTRFDTLIAASKKRNFTNSECNEIDTLLAERETLYSRRDELREQERRSGLILHAQVDMHAAGARVDVRSPWRW